MPPPRNRPRSSPGPGQGQPRHAAEGGAPHGGSRLGGGWHGGSGVQFTPAAQNRRHPDELFSRQDAKRLLDRVAEDNPKIVEDVVPKLLSLAVLQKVLQNLLRERVSIRDAVSILEALGEAGNVTRNPVLLTEYARQALGRAIVQPYLGPKGDLPAFFLDSSVEQAIESSVEHGEHSSQLNLAPQRIREILERVAKRIQNVDG